MNYEPPFIANLLSYILIAALIFLFVYSLIIRKEDSAPKVPILDRPLNTINTDSFVEYDTGRCPDFEQRKAATINDKPAVFLTMIIPSKNADSSLICYLEKIILFLNDKTYNGQKYPFEVILPIDPLNEQILSLIYDFGRQFKELRIFKAAHKYSLTGLVNRSINHTRGSFILILNPRDKLEICDIDRYLNQINPIESPRGFVVSGTWKPTINPRYNSTLCWFLDCCEKLCAEFGRITPDLVNHCHTILITREAAKWFNINFLGNSQSFDTEILMLATKMKINVTKIALDAESPYFGIYSTERFINLADVFVAAISARFNFWKIRKPRT